MFQENFIAQYGSVGNSQVPIRHPGQPNSQNTSSVQSFTDDDLYEEGDDEFEGEEEGDLSLGLSQQEEITIEPELPITHDYEDQGKYEDERIDYQEEHQTPQLFNIQQLIEQNSSISIKNESTVNGVPIERKFKCEMCDAAFMSKINLQRYVIIQSIFLLTVFAVK